MKRNWAVSGRTIGAHFFETEKEARDFISSFQDCVIAYDEEIALYKRGASGGFEEVERY